MSALPLLPDPVLLKDLDEVEPGELIDKQWVDKELAHDLQRWVKVVKKWRLGKNLYDRRKFYIVCGEKLTGVNYSKW